MWKVLDVKVVYFKHSVTKFKYQTREDETKCRLFK